jgi:hypothetical protein
MLKFSISNWKIGLLPATIFSCNGTGARWEETGRFFRGPFKGEGDSVLSSPRSSVSAAGVDTDYTVGSGQLTDRIKYPLLVLLG